MGRRFDWGWWDPLLLKETPIENSIIFSKHASDRIVTRGLKESDIEFVLLYGKIYHRAGSIQYILRKKDIPKNFKKQSNISRLEGTTIIASKIGQKTIITVYRNKQSTKKERKKTKYSIKKKYDCLPLAN